MDDLKIMPCPKCNHAMRFRIHDYYNEQLYEVECSVCGLRSGAMRREEIIKKWSEELSQKKVFVGKITPTSEGLPDPGVYVLACSKNFEGGWYVLCVDEDGLCWYDEDTDHWTNTKNVTAWMPLPEPYRGDEE